MRWSWGGVVADLLAAHQVGQHDASTLHALGLVEGARVTLIHEGPVGGDPVVLDVEGMRIALRRHEVRGLSLALTGTDAAE